MTAPVAIPLEDRFAPAIEAVNAWRGRCLASFARAERAVSEALVALGGAGGPTPIPLLVGQRYAALTRCLEQRAGGSNALATLRAFAKHDDLRVFLCHGDSRITLDRKGRWQATFTLLCGRGDGVERRFLLIDEEDAGGLVKALEDDRNRLVSLLSRTMPSPGARPLGDIAVMRVGVKTS